MGRSPEVVEGAQRPCVDGRAAKLRETAGRLVAGHKCPALSKSGRPCRAAPTVDGFCFFHSPTVSAEEKRLAVVRGGIAAHPRVLPGAADVRFNTPGEVLSVLEETASDVRRGNLAPAIANALGYLCTVALRSIELDVLGRLEAAEKTARLRHLQERG